MNTTTASVHQAAIIKPGSKVLSRVIPQLSFHLIKRQIQAREGTGILAIASILAYTICSALTLTVAGGTQLFYNRWRHPHGILAQVVAADKTFDLVLMFYFVLAIIACALLVPILSGLASSAAVLGAQGRQERFATLRLLGFTSWDVIKLTLIDVALFVLTGAFLGWILYEVTLPAWSHMTLMAMPLSRAEMQLPATLILLILAAVFALALVSAIWGMRRVNISPLGVSRRSIAPKLKKWRLVAFLVISAGLVIWALTFKLNSSFITFIVLAAIILAAVFTLTVFLPWLLQVVAGAISHLPNPAVMWASRRIQADSKTVFRRISGVVFLAFIAGYISLMPISFSSSKEGVASSFISETVYDLSKGAFITIGIGFVVTATSILINQASAVYERASQSQAMARMGVAPSFQMRVTWLEYLAPLIVTVLLSTAVGVLLSLPMYDTTQRMMTDSVLTGLAVLLSVLAAGFLISVLALLATEPLQRRIATAHIRDNA